MERVVLSQLMSLAQSAPMTQVRAIATQALRRIQSRNAAPVASGAEGAHRQLIVDDVKRFLEQGADTLRPATTPDAPPGAPMGTTIWITCWDWISVASGGRKRSQGPGSKGAEGSRTLWTLGPLDPGTLTVLAF